MQFYCINSIYRPIWTYSFIHNQIVDNSQIVNEMLMARVLHTKRADFGAFLLTKF